MGEYTSIVKRLIREYGNDTYAMARILGDVAQISKQKALAIINEEIVQQAPKSKSASDILEKNRKMNF